MKKIKQTNDKRKSARKTTLLGGASKSLRKLGKGATNSIGSLSTTQKVVGGATLLALGLSYFNKRRSRAAKGDTTAASVTGAEQNLAAIGQEESGSNL